MFSKLNQWLAQFSFGISGSEKILFAQHLALMMKTGMGQIEALRVIQGQTQSSQFKRILEDLITNLENGQFLSSSLERYQRIFGDFFINIIKLGELSGTLPGNLEYLAQETRKKQELEAKVRSAMIYPLVILFATVGITSVIIFFVIPKILPIFASLKIDLPQSTRFLIWSISFFRDNFVWIILGFLAASAALIASVRIYRIRNFYDRVLVSLPLIGKIIVYYNVVNITRTLGVLLKSGVKIIEAFDITAGLASNTEYQKVLKESVDRVKKGETIYGYISTQTNLFPSTVGRIIGVGERTGNLDANLFYLSEFYENELDQIVKNLSSVLEPAMLILMGGIVGFVAISIITPIYQVTQSLRR
ncbi:MAG: type II secretion system F domain protein, type IV pilus assembly protein PilC [Parcubacteria group bacterium GW2011_GWC1_45_9]|nr:MAG: hypothetical protein UW85_C0003G0047 [Parcubacteria group bacterium GW2011_GWA1_Parcubacteria_45_10]KKT87813.1 MAG: hypothetical protein UW89_C0017G0005 [Parcubacteria group bacterium GW2011_GWB1_45_10]KKU16355.1 MAG: type II secretion system F domain protein, type IV pilus assembly protein PilC [Parcubacteria group bacterium GW2011_GWC1_45_9]HCI05688.1 hypothetical protein [Patescibacteria group bacterium]